MSYSYTERLANEINDFITEKVKDLDNYQFREVMENVEGNISDQLQALNEDEAADHMEDEE